jgi:hypothetical protein
MIKTLLLVLILLLAFFMAYIPHIGYAYPLHGDEWIHLAYANSVVDSGAITFLNPFSGLTLSGPGSNFEMAYHLLLAMLHQVGGVDWLMLFRFGAALAFMLTVLAVYVLARHEGYGLQAAFFTCLIPTSIGILGPAFMVPMALGLLFIPLSLFIAFRCKTWPAYLLISLIASFLWLLHPPTAAVLCIVLAPCILINLKDNRLHSIGLSAGLLIPFLIALPLMFKQILSAAGKFLAAQPAPSHVDIPALLLIYGVLPMIFCFAGLIYLINRGGRDDWALVLGMTLLLLSGVAVTKFNTGLSIVYLRSLTSMLLLIGTAAGAGLYWLSRLRLPPPLGQTGAPLCFLAVVVILAMTLPVRLDYAYYRLIDDEDYRTFTWIKENVEADDYPAIVDPWKGSAFTALTGMNVLRYIGSSKILADDLINSYLNSGCPESGFLRDNRVSLAYNRQPCNSSSLLKTRDNVYKTTADITDGFATAAVLKNGSFEIVSGRPPANWARKQSNSKPTFLFPEPGRTGGSSAGLEMTAAAPYKPLPYARWQQQVAAQAGSSYIIGGWIKTQEIAGDGGARLAVQWRNAANKSLKTAELMPYIKGTGGWTYYEYKVTAPAGSVTCLLWLELASCSGAAWFDDITFTAE